MAIALGKSVAGRKNSTPRLFQLRRRERPRGLSRAPPPPPVIDVMTRELAREMASTRELRREPVVGAPSLVDDSDAPEGEAGRDDARTSNARGNIETPSSSPSVESKGDVGTDVDDIDALEMMPRVVRINGPRSRCHRPF